MKTAALLLILAILVAVGGFLIFFSGDMAPETDFSMSDQVTEDSQDNSDSDGNSNLNNLPETDSSENESSSQNSNSNSNDMDINSQDYSDNQKYQGGVEELPNTDIISDEVDMVILGLSMIVVSVYLIRSGLLYRFMLNTNQRIFGIDLTSFDYNNASWIQKKIYEKMTSR
jgi:hypothetical protein